MGRGMGWGGTTRLIEGLGISMGLERPRKGRKMSMGVRAGFPLSRE